jgi:CDP-glucose 4,6-dehydratase
MTTDFWGERPVLVTGASGLLGSWLVEALLGRGASVVCIVRDRVPHSRLITAGLADRVVIVSGDVTDQELLERAIGEHEIRSVFHLAAQTIVGIANRNPVSTFTSNVQGTWTLLEACRRSPLVTEVVVASSDKAYGEQASLPYTEETPLAGRHPYDASKSAADLIAQSYATTWGVPVCITRCGNFFGGGDLNWNRLVPGTVRDLLMGRRPVIRSDGSFVRDYLYVEDGADAYIRTAEAIRNGLAQPGSAFNFSMERPLSVLELVAEIQSTLGTAMEPEILGEATHEIPRQYLDSTRARTELQWKPTTGLEEGLERTVRWYREFLEGTK